MYPNKSDLDPGISARPLNDAQGISTMNMTTELQSELVQWT